MQGTKCVSYTLFVVSVFNLWLCRVYIENQGKGSLRETEVFLSPFSHGEKKRRECAQCCFRKSLHHRIAGE